MTSATRRAPRSLSARISAPALESTFADDPPAPSCSATRNSASRCAPRPAAIIATRHAYRTASTPASPSSRTHRSRCAFIARKPCGVTSVIRMRLAWKENVASFT